MSTVVRQPSAKAELPVGTFVTESASVNLQINMPPVVQLRLHDRIDAKEQAIQAVSGDAAAKVGASQTQIFQARTTPDSTVTLDDGNEGQLIIKGYLNNPGYSFGIGEVGLQESVIHESASLAAIDGSIYRSLKSEWRTEVAYKIDDGDLATRVANVQKKVITFWQAYKERPLLDYAQDAAIREKVHAVNEVLLPAWYKVLENSTGLWPEIMQLSPDTRKGGLNNFIAALLTQQAQDFLQVMMRFNAAFQTVWVPSLDPGVYGKFVEMRSIMQQAEDLDLPVERVNFSGGSPRLLPISHALVQGSARMVYRGSPEGQDAIAGAIVGVWPEQPYAGGSVIRDPGPPWLGEIRYLKSYLKKASAALNLSAFKSSRAAASKKIVSEQLSPQAEILKLWARNLYAWYSLESSTASVTIPLDLKIQLGKSYKCRTKSGQLFQGFLAGVSHQLAGGNDSGIAQTTLSFSHIEAGSFTLPNK